MRCVACDSTLGAYTKGDLCTVCASIVLATAKGTYNPVEPDNVEELIECVNTNAKIGYPTKK